MQSKIIILLLFFFSKSLLFAQDYTTLEILNLEKETARLSVNQAFKDLKLPKMHLWKNQTTTESSFYTYRTLMVKNRFVFKVNVTANKLTVSIRNRQYQSNSNWIDNPLPMSKKQAAKILDPLKEKILELSKNKIITQNNTDPSNSKTLKSKEAGIYEDFIIVKTGNPEMDLLAIHKNGHLIGYNLSENKTSVKSLIFKEHEYSEAITLLFNDDNTPKGIVFSEYIINFSVQENNLTELSLYDNNGNFINKNVTKIEDLDSFSTSIIQEKNGQGPNLASILFENNAMSLATKLGYASTALQTALCGGLIITGAGIPAAAIVCGSLLLDITVKVLPKENFMYDTLSLASMATAFIPMGNPLKIAPLITNSAKLSELLAGLTSIANGAENYYENHIKEVKIVIEGPSTIRTGYFGEKGEPIILYAKSEPNIPIQWQKKSEAILMEKLEPNDTRNKEGYSAIQIWAISPSNKKPIIVASQSNNKDGALEYIELEIISPNYFYFLDCAECGKNIPMDSKLKEKIDACKKQLENCKKQAVANKDILLIVNSKNEVIEPKLNERKLNFIKKNIKKDGTPYPVNEQGEFKEFVKEASCNFNCSGFDDKQTIISLAHEAMGKIKINETKIKELQKTAELILKQDQNASEEKLLKIAKDLKILEENSKKIRTEYGEKINKIAEKGTIEFMYKKTDKSQCYGFKGSVRTKGAHWTRPSLTILLEYNILPISCKEKLEYGTIFKGKGVSNITFRFLDNKNKQIMKARTSIAQFTTITMDIKEFKKTEIIEFFKSNPIGPFN
ncbi:hypothetical protein [Ilyobacter sp.]|uniref:hypothetical protein n=1 Tax=Ilyobacter sp. TaxID=3100343 RepID=UPI00356A23C1